MMDALTGLPSRAEFTAFLRDGGAAGMPGIYLNIDGFNGVNCEFAHVEGDRILTVLAGWLAGRAKELGLQAFRVGGNEFVLAGTALASDGALTAAESLVRESQSLGLPYAHPRSQRDVFSLSAVVFRATTADEATFAGALDELGDAAYRAELQAGRDHGVVASAAAIAFPRA
jgi:diguanylate cyclase (GGDEF)-like protein